MLSGWLIVAALVLLGIFLKPKWLAVISFGLLVLVGILNGIVFVWGVGYEAYGGWLVFSFTSLAVGVLVILWVSAATTWIVRKFTAKKK